ncbi:MAG: hypothetical protein HFE25_02860 [Clostridia bacterium]|nr:hypothetical protein [Clostridia bacterium]
MSRFPLKRGNKLFPTYLAAKSAVKTVGFLFKLCYTCYGQRFSFDRLRSGGNFDAATRVSFYLAATGDFTSSAVVTPNCLRPAFPLFVKNEFRESAFVKSVRAEKQGEGIFVPFSAEKGKQTISDRVCGEIRGKNGRISF